MANLTASFLRFRNVLAHPQLQKCLFHSTTPVDQTLSLRNTNGNFPVTMIPGDGVGPELMDSVQEVWTYFL